MARSIGFEGTLFDGVSDEPVEDKGPKVLTVTQASQLAKQQLEKINVTVEGEVSEVSDKAGYKAVYFTLADESSALSCLMWRNNYARSGMTLRKGMLVQITGHFTYYVAKGRVNFDVRSIKLAGEGDLRMRVAELARKLQAEGLMDPSRKKLLPRMAAKIAVVTSPRGKAVHDVLRTLRRRSPQVEVYICGVPVEGDGAPEAICNGLAVADRSDCDVILLVRGGGSYEDLMPFNDEKVARAVAACVHPVVTGIGHEPDNSIADMVADRRCSTPTAAAEASAVEIVQLAQQLDQLGMRASGALSARLDRARHHLDQLATRPLFTDPSFLIGTHAMRLDADADRLARAIPGALAANRQALEQARLRLAAALPGTVRAARSSVDAAGSALRGAGMRLLVGPRSRLALSAARLEDLSPVAILSRGYAIAYDADGRAVRSVGQVSPGDPLDVMVDDGRLKCTVEDTVRKALD